MLQLQYLFIKIHRFSLEVFYNITLLTVQIVSRWLYRCIRGTIALYREWWQSPLLHTPVHLSFTLYVN